MATVCKLRRPGQGGGGLAVRPLFSPSYMSYFLPHSWDRHSALQVHNGCGCVEMALSAVPLSWLFPCAFLSHSSIGCFPCFPLFRHFLFFVQCCVGDEGPYKGDLAILNHH